jgi:hypothetical protein
MIKILILEENKYLVESEEAPKEGHYYFLESATEGTLAQNKTFHALTMEYFKSGMHSYNADSYKEFKKQIKRQLGQGFDAYIYGYILDGKPKTKKVSNKKDIPEYILNDPDFSENIIGNLKSWSDYTKKQRKETIDNVISEMLQSGINTPKFQEIMKGLES